MTWTFRKPLQGEAGAQGSATIPNHVDGSRNHLDSLLESGNQVEILESEIGNVYVYQLWIFSFFSYITNHAIHKPLFGKQESQESIKELQNQAKRITSTKIQSCGPLA